jgi:hypothetical protein
MDYEVVVKLEVAVDGNEGKTGYDQVLLTGRLPFVPQKRLWVWASENDREVAEFRVHEVTYKMERKGDGVRGYFEILADESESRCSSKFLIESFRKIGWTAAVVAKFR